MEGYMRSWTAVRGRSGPSSTFTLSLPSEIRLCHSNTRARDVQSSPQASVNNWEVSVADFFSFTRNFVLTRCFTFAVRHFPTEDKNTSVFQLRTHVLSKAIELSLVILRQLRTCSTAVCWSLPHPLDSWAIGLVFFGCRTTCIYKGKGKGPPYNRLLRPLGRVEV